VGQWLLLPVIGPVGLGAAGALLMLTFGGLAQIYCDEPPSRAGHQRLGLVFASLAAAIAVFPQNVKRWSVLAQEQGAAAVWVDGAWLARHAPPGSRRFCLIGVNDEPASAAPRAWAPPPSVSIERTFPVTRGGWVDGPRDRRVRFDNACRALRLDRGRYELIHQHGPLPSAGRRYAGYSIEWLAALARHRAAGGRVILDVPLSGLSEASVRVIARTFEEALPGPHAWSLERVSGRPALRLVAGADAEAGADAAWRRLDGEADNEPAVHSLKRDRLTSTVPPAPGRSAYDFLLRASFSSPIAD
jgi:hypothetical protein